MRVEISFNLNNLKACRAESGQDAKELINSKYATNKEGGKESHVCFKNLNSDTFTKKLYEIKIHNYFIKQMKII